MVPRSQPRDHPGSFGSIWFRVLRLPFNVNRTTLYPVVGTPVVSDNEVHPIAEMRTIIERGQGPSSSAPPFAWHLLPRRSLEKDSTSPELDSGSRCGISLAASPTSEDVPFSPSASCGLGTSASIDRYMCVDGRLVS